LSPPLGRKQANADSSAWEQAADLAEKNITPGQLDDLTAAAAAAVRAHAREGRHIGYGWSGGKDSQALRYVMDAAGITDCVLGMTTGLEWPAMLRWQTDHMPHGCDIRAVPLDLPWLAARPQMLFPQGADGSRWFTVVQHRAQRAYYQDRNLDTLILGRRRKDGNYVGPAGSDSYTNSHGMTIWSPLAAWSHEHVLALIRRESLPLPPCYTWPRGWQVGTGPWPARQWTRDTDHGFEECWQIDPDVIRQAAPHLPAAAAWMRQSGRE
jgi:3'-phosphoadenosine 5'-phosphosulfate sulfotransferase (PAPS reductase)/FAD synthetase